jgi:Flp pilus assembly pilin Flp
MLWEIFSPFMADGDGEFRVEYSRVATILTDCFRLSLDW